MAILYLVGVEPLYLLKYLVDVQPAADVHEHATHEEQPGAWLGLGLGLGLGSGLGPATLC